MSTKLDSFSIVNEVNVLPETTLVLVGTALDGPANIPFELYDDTDPYEALGFSPLAHAYSAARNAGAGRIIAYRLNGIHSTAIIKDGDGNELFSLRSVSAADSYNDIHIILHPDYLFVKNTDGVTTRNYFFNKYPTVNDLVNAINRDAYYGLLEFNAEIINQYASMMNAVNSETNILFSDGYDESYLIHHRDPSANNHTDESMVAAALKSKLEYALFGEDSNDISNGEPYGDLATLEYGVIVLVDIFHDDTIINPDTQEVVNAGFTEMLGLFCLNKTEEYETGCIGVIGVKPTYVSDDIHQRALDLISLTQSLEDTESYKYAQVIIGDMITSQSNGEVVSCAYIFGARQAILPFNTIMSNKQMYGISKLNSEMTKEDVALLSSNGYTCIVPSIRRGFVPYYSTSYSKKTTDSTSRPHNIRISQHITSAIEQTVDSLIGSEYTMLSVKNAISEATNILSDLQSNDVIKSYDVTYSLSDNNTSLHIEVSFTPMSEVTTISSIATLTFPREVTS